nr:immunoglobulin heavy chain junction region [Macaca mulatta]MOW99510.1 immunoglobulin heavy chain junction region [Macaca mulatta]MOW99590.1 immunoglobulin heavy chain junction region [Macaca mulatta]MOX02118.1 immunoglobulin heavy chain junction region [Macaca mulatta]MOX03928.1 immunoglobulin heavy chain junction region [Macaca mulatta]
CARVGIQWVQVYRLDVW